MAVRLVLGVLFVLGIALAPAPQRRVPSSALPSAGSPALSRRPTGDDSGEFVHAIVRGSSERPLGIVLA